MKPLTKKQRIAAYEYCAEAVHRGQWGSFMCLNFPEEIVHPFKQLPELNMFRGRRVTDCAWFPIGLVDERLTILALCIEITKTESL